MADPTGERISEAEYAVMEALWAKGSLTAGEVAAVVAPPRGWGLATVKTLLSRLVAKQVVSTQPDGKRFRYAPLIARDAYVGGESRRLMDRLFGGSAAGLFAHLAESEALSQADLDQISDLLEELRK